MSTVAQVVGWNMRRLRESHAKVLLDVATAARDLGLRWDPSAVSRIETGKRELSLEEFLALPLVMTLALDRTVGLSELLRRDYPLVENFGRITSLDEVRTLLAEPALADAGFGAEVVAVVYESLEEEKRKAQLARAPGEDAHLANEIRSVAAELNVRTGDVLPAYRALWGEFTISISKERERRLLESGADISSPTTVRTLRGHITRQIMAELRDYFASQRGGSDDGQR